MRSLHIAPNTLNCLLNECTCFDGLLVNHFKLFFIAKVHYYKHDFCIIKSIEKETQSARSFLCPFVILLTSVAPASLEQWSFSGFALNSILLKQKPITFSTSLPYPSIEHYIIGGIQTAQPAAALNSTHLIFS